MSGKSELVKEKPQSQCWVWDVRWNEGVGCTIKEILASLEGVAKKYVIQQELGEGGLRHFQGRISLIKKKYKHTKLSAFGENPELLPNFFQPTVTEEHRKEAFYCMKEETRIGGPWKDTDPIEPILTKQLELFIGWGLKPWMKTLEEKVNTFSLRKIDLVYDPTGNNGKSLFSEYLEYKGVGEEVPCYRLMDDIFQWVCSRPIKKVYIMDLPRGMKKDKLADLYSGIEVIKNGVAFDKRNHAKKKRFDRPRIIVFTNVLPCLDLMTRDRWQIWIIQNGQLFTYIF